ncbi:regulatory protein RecX [Agromyces larvae]|uniref:Regulatory protein RecX n=1 Tax=Agromyces larvae TaxID=2929802 RepID=A0ABY4C454_9MICO|nr:regulatory protein RecX [Agromyces larvae]UOE44758.1 RecX family transcriptional regulator [Agromyces larvae]
MSDPSSDEHLAPVSYLPWAIPGRSIHEADDGDAAVADPVGDDSPGDDSPGDDRPFGDAARSQQRHPAGGRGSRRSTRPRLAVVGGTGPGERGAGPGERGAEPGERGAGPEDRGAGPGERGAGRRAGVTGTRRRGESLPQNAFADETGPERDERIDRLVVSRLRRSSLSIAEVRGVLVEHGLDDVEVDEWIERYRRLGYLDDARLAEQLVHVQTSRRGRGSSAILSELGRRGIDPVIAREAVDALDPAAEREQALEVAERRHRQLRGLERHVAERRLSAFLQRRGYPAELVRDVLSQVLGADRS